MTNQRQKSPDRPEPTDPGLGNTRRSAEGENQQSEGMPLAMAGGGYGGSACTTKAASEEGDYSDADSD